MRASYLRKGMSEHWDVPSFTIHQVTEWPKMVEASGRYGYLEVVDKYE